MNLKLTAIAAAVVFVAALSATNRTEEGGTPNLTAAASNTQDNQNLDGEQLQFEELHAQSSSKAEPPAKPASEERINRITTPKARVNANNVTVRSAPSTEAARVATVSRGTDAWIIGPSGAWYKLKFPNGTVGFVRGDFLNPITDSSVPAAANNGTYKVVQGDTSQKIARKLGTTPEALQSANPGTNWTRLQIGQTLAVPGANPPAASRPARVTGASGERVNDITTAYARINTDGVTVRKGPSTSHDRITTVNRGLDAKIVGREGAWYKLEFPRGTTGYVRGDFLNAVTPRNVGRATGSSGVSAAANVPASNLRLVAEARKHIGTRYSYGGMTTRGFDCSGFVSYVYRAAEGISLPRTSVEQSRHGTPVQYDNLQPGDILSFRTRGGGRINHSGIYIGSGQFIHASSAGGSVRVDRLDSGFYRQRFAGARRVASSLTQLKPDLPAEQPKQEEIPPADVPPPSDESDIG